MQAFTIKGVVLAAAVAVSALANQALAQAEKVVVQMKWVPQAQFAGYYVAAAKGYYKAGGAWMSPSSRAAADVSPVQVLAGNQADAIVNWMPERARWPPARPACRWSTSPRSSTSRA